MQGIVDSLPWTAMDESRALIAKDHPEQVLCCRYTVEVEYPRTHFTT
jgi:hypothetical protein